jgi:hypothetical protein
VAGEDSRSPGEEELCDCSLHAGELSENSLISEIFVSSSEKIWLVFLLNAYAFRDDFNLLIERRRRGIAITTSLPVCRTRLAEGPLGNTTPPCFYLLNLLLMNTAARMSTPYNNSGVYSSSLGGSTVP